MIVSITKVKSGILLSGIIIRIQSILRCFSLSLVFLDRLVSRLTLLSKKQTSPTAKFVLKSEGDCGCGYLSQVYKAVTELLMKMGKIASLALYEYGKIKTVKT